MKNVTIRAQLSRREYFAGQALVGIISNPHFYGPLMQQSAHAAAEFAVECADALLLELKRANYGEAGDILTTADV